MANKTRIISEDHYQELEERAADANYWREEYQSECSVRSDYENILDEIVEVVYEHSGDRHLYKDLPQIIDDLIGNQ